MKKLITILLLGIHIFNMGGHSVLFEYLINTNDAQLIKQLDEHGYDKNKLIELKIHLPLPYNATFPEYERIDGEVQYNGVAFNYVMRKICNDTLYVLCLPNTGKMTLAEAKSEYASKTSDIPADHSRSPFAKKENVTCDPLTAQLFFFKKDISKKIFYSFDSPLIISVEDSPDQPPEIS